MFTVRRTPATSTCASRLGSSTISMIWPGMARHIGASPPRCARDRPVSSRWSTVRPRSRCNGPDGGGLLASDMPVPEQRDAVERHLLRDTAYDTLRDGDRRRDARAGRDAARRRALLVARPQPHAGPRRAAPARGRRPRGDGAAALHARSPRCASMTRRRSSRCSPRSTRWPPSGPSRGWSRPTTGCCATATTRHHAALSRADAEAAYATDDRFHGVFVDVSRNPEIGRGPRAPRSAAAPAGAAAARRAPGPARSVAQHEAIIDRARRGDAAGTASATRENWLELGALIERSLVAAAQVPSLGHGGVS